MSISEDVTATLRAEEHGHQPVVVYDASRRHDYQPFGNVCETVQAHYGTGGGNTPIVVMDMTHANDVIRIYDGKVVPTLQARMGTGGNQVPLILEEKL